MSINTITPSFNNRMPHDEVSRIKRESDEKNNTAELRVPPGDNKVSSHGQAAHIVRNINDDKKMDLISADVDSADYFNELINNE